MAINEGWLSWPLAWLQMLIWRRQRGMFLLFDASTVPDNAILTEGGDALVTEGGDFLVQE